MELLAAHVSDTFKDLGLDVPTVVTVLGCNPIGADESRRLEGYQQSTAYGEPILALDVLMESNTMDAMEKIQAAHEPDRLLQFVQDFNLRLNASELSEVVSNTHCDFHPHDPECTNHTKHDNCL